METLGGLLPCCIATLFLLSALCNNVAFAAKFTIANGCSYPVWPGILSNAGSTLLGNGGFELAPGQSASIQVSPGWSGRLWGRTECKFSASGTGTCASGDCGGKLQCQGAGATPPATLAEFTLAGRQPNVKQDFYDVSLVDGYNIPIAVVPTSGIGTCGTAGCARDLNTNCPAELQVVSEGMSDGGSSVVVGCKSACDAFGDPRYCCAGAYANPTTCKPSSYSEIFKSACPRAYSYAFDDPTSTFTCTNADYTILFCPSSSSQKTVTGLQQPESDLMGTQAYARATSPGQAGPKPTSCLILAATVTSLVVSFARFPFVRLSP
ncbi:hypothetical protein GOP47_0005461 [Adiantum capillus-veneris]|uniref:Thaumatin-like protein n=1 Tax=Adiantum capillus-veneris TaxID=13818 RepID=A0A9D4V5V1_ADICA|nr:hypothetical protein GOP47_0005461 [Adiantum capillus-veneris]